MRKVKFQYFIPGVRPLKEGGAKDYTKWIDGTNVYSDPITGHFHGWGLELDESGNSPVSYTVAICEDRGGKIHMVHANKIEFLDPISQ